MQQHVLALLVALAFASSPGMAQNVKITPLGSHTGELCDRDRATIFEDPTGVRILYDAGHSVTGADYPRQASRSLRRDRWRLVVPLPAACLAGVHLGGTRMMKTAGATRAVEITAVAAADESTVSRTVAVINLVKGRRVYPALSGRTLEFDGDAKCVAGC